MSIVDELETYEAEKNANEITMPLIPSFPEVIDNTGNSAFKKCEKYWQYNNVLKIKPNSPSIHLHAGAAFAKGIEIVRKSFYENKLSPSASLEAGVEALIKSFGDFEVAETSTKSCERMVLGLISYFENYPIESDYLKPYYSKESNTYGIEFSFALPIERKNGEPLLHPETGNPLLYAGKFDMLAEANGSLFVEDEKTTSQLGEQWRKQWNLDSQFTGYCWGAISYGLPVAGAIIRGISFLKNGNGHAEATIFRPQWQIDRWHDELIANIDKMLEIYKSNKFRYALDKAICGNYGGCSFSLLCESPTPDEWIPINYQKNSWNPLHREEI